MNEKIKGTAFLKEWCSVISQDDRINIETYGDSDKFTDIVLKESVGEPSCIMKKLSSSLYENQDKIINTSLNDYENKDYPEYFKIDYTIWKNYTNPIPDLFKKMDLKKHCSKMLLAMEHENNCKDWTDEFAKLFSVHCELRVVVGYFDYNTYGINSLIDFLGELTSIMIGNCDNFFGEYLLILGLPKSELEKLGSDINNKDIAEGYKGFQLVNNNGNFRWEEIEA